MSGQKNNGLIQRETLVDEVRRLCYKGNPAGIDRVVQSIPALKRDEIREIAGCLYLLGDDLVKPMIESLVSDNEGIVECASVALGHLADERALEPLLGMLTTRGKPERAILARNGLALFGENAVPGLTRLLSAKAADTRYHAVVALAYIGSREPLAEILSLAQSDRSSRVREAALEALRVIPLTDEDELCQVYTSLNHPFYPNSTCEEMTAINGVLHSPAWIFDRDDLESAYEDLESPYTPVITGILKGYQELLFRGYNPECFVLLGDRNVDPDDPSDELIMSLPGLSPYRQGKEHYNEMSMILTSYFMMVAGYREMDVLRPGLTGVQPLYHLVNGGIELLNREDSEEAEQSMDYFNAVVSGKPIGQAEAFMDTARIHQQALDSLVADGHFQHLIPPGIGQGE